MRLSIRARLTAWYALLAAVALAVVGAFLVLKLRTDLRSTIDREVRSAVSVIEQSYLAEGRLKYRESIIHGLDNAPAGLFALLRGENFGKQLVKLA